MPLTFSSWEKLIWTGRRIPGNRGEVINIIPDSAVRQSNRFYRRAVEAEKVVLWEGEIKPHPLLQTGYTAQFNTWSPFSKVEKGKGVHKYLVVIQRPEDGVEV